MVIARPITRTTISTNAFGVPLTDFANFWTPTAWASVIFANGWRNFGGAFQAAQYRRVGDIVQVRGLISSGVMGQTAFTLPSGFRPPATLQFPAESGNIHGAFEVWASGTVVPIVGSNGTFNVNVAFAIS